MGKTRKEVNSIRNERILYAAIWTIIAILPIVLELWNTINNSEFKWEFVIRWWVGMIPLILIFLIHNHFLLPKFMKKGRIIHYCVTLALLLTAYGVIQHVTEKHDKKELKERPIHSRPPFDLKDTPPTPPPGHDRRPDKPPHPFPFPLLFKLMLAAMTLGANVSISLVFTYNREQTKRRELDNQKLQEELKYLKQQISPHFLMNILNNIHEMADEDIKEAQNMILELSQLMRYVLYESENKMTTLAAESRFISSYVSLMKKRYVEGVVTVNLDISDNTTNDTHIPPLLFISFIENAFKHGVSYNSKTKIYISLHEMDNKIMFSCHNTIPPARKDIFKGGVGLSNIKRRLDLLYGKDYSLRITQKEDTYSVTLTIPS